MNKHLLALLKEQATIDRKIRAERVQQIRRVLVVHVALMVVTGLG